MAYVCSSRRAVISFLENTHFVQKHFGFSWRTRECTVKKCLSAKSFGNGFDGMCGFKIALSQNDNHTNPLEGNPIFAYEYMYKIFNNIELIRHYFKI